MSTWEATLAQAKLIGVYPVQGTIWYVTDSPTLLLVYKDRVYDLISWMHGFDERMVKVEWNTWKATVSDNGYNPTEELVRAISQISGPEIVIMKGR